MKKIIFIFVCFLLVLPHITSAKVNFSEIMYDLEGTDTGREWIEIYNNSTETIDLSKYYLFENNVAHKISFASGSSTIGIGGYAVIADNINNFLIDFPNFVGSLFDSVFSLANEGEEIILMDNLKNTVDTLKYDPSLGANGTGNSLQISGGILIAAESTPGLENKTEAVNESIDSTEENDTSIETDSNSSTHTDQNSLSDYKPSTKNKTGIGRDRRISINNSVELEIYKSTDEKGKFIWSFGDGDSEKGKKVYHEYDHPGIYNVVMSAYFDGYKTVSRAKIYVDKPEIDLNIKDNILKITNVGKNELNIGDFEVQTNFFKHKVVKDTILSKGQSIYLDIKNKPQNLKFLYPNGKPYDFGIVGEKGYFCANVINQGISCN